MSMQRNVLIIDDDQSFRKILGLRLRSIVEGAVLHEVATLQAARDYLRDNKIIFDLVVLDQHLPDGVGVDILNEGVLRDLAVLAVSSDTASEMAGNTVSAGATFFLNKMQISEQLFKPLVLGIIERNRLQRELQQTKVDLAVTDTIKTLVSTLRHEINNPLGAVLGAAYILRTGKDVSSEQKEAAELVEASGKRIKHVLDQLCKAISIEPVQKAHEKVFHIPGDKPWKA